MNKELEKIGSINVGDFKQGDAFVSMGIGSLAVGHIADTILALIREELLGKMPLRIEHSKGEYGNMHSYETPEDKIRNDLLAEVRKIISDTLGEG